MRDIIQKLRGYKEIDYVHVTALEKKIEELKKEIEIIEKSLTSFSASSMTRGMQEATKSVREVKVQELQEKRDELDALARMYEIKINLITLLSPHSDLTNKEGAIFQARNDINIINQAIEKFPENKTLQKIAELIPRILIILDNNIPEELNKKAA